MKNIFQLPKDKRYFCAHSLGLMPKAILNDINNLLLEEWSEHGVQSWNAHGWFNLPVEIGNSVASIIGADPGEVIVADSTSVNLFKVLCAAIQLRPSRKTIVIEEKIFPTDLYIADAVAKLHPDVSVKRVDPKRFNDVVDEDVVAVVVSHVDYLTGELYCLKSLANVAHKNDALIIADLSHSIGVCPINVKNDGVDFAIACTYKYLNGGPGSPSLLYCSSKHLGSVESPLQGWIGHQKPFSFDPNYIARDGIKRFQCGTPPIISLRALSVAVSMMNKIDIDQVRVKSQQLTAQLINEMLEHCPELEIISPLDADHRGSHIAVTHHESYAISRMLIEKNMIVDYREPNVIRFGVSPLYNSEEDIDVLVEVIKQIMSDKSYMKFNHRKRDQVT